MADWLVVNEVEGACLSGETAYDAIPAALRAKYPGVSILLTLGGEGCRAVTDTEDISLPAKKVTVVDTTGAGDIFGGSAMSQFLKCGKAPAELTGADLEHIVRFACTAASLSTQKHGGISSVPEENAVLGKMAE